MFADFVHVAGGQGVSVGKPSKGRQGTRPPGPGGYPNDPLMTHFFPQNVTFSHKNLQETLM